MDKKERMDAVYDALGNLSDKLRSALVLVRFEDMSYKEAASTLDISLSALKQRVRRATRKLEDALPDSTD